jgi:hypothetical protein
VLDYGVDSVRGFLRIWIVVALLLVVYSFVDLGLNPWLHGESHFSMRPDWSRLPDLVHWGGRLLRHGAVSLWIANALLISGAVALLIQSVLRVVGRLRSAKDSPPEERVSIVSAPTSVPPQGSS